MENNEQQDLQQYDQQPFDQSAEFPEQKPAVGSVGSKNTVVIAIVGIIGILILGSIIFGEEEEVVKRGATEIDKRTLNQGDNKRVIAPDVIGSDVGADIDSFAPPPPPPPPPPPLPADNAPAQSYSLGRQSGYSRNQSVSRKDIIERIKSPMFISGKGSGGSLFGGSLGLGGSSSDGAASQLPKSNVATVLASKTSDLRSTIATGKVIDAVLETAINTLLPGMLRAVVSRDVYAEQGRTILIPKGSRLIGKYDTKIGRGQARVLITWNRVVRPDGIDVALESPAVDLLGRTGVKGGVDNRYFELFSSSLLLSSLTIAFATAGDELIGGGSIEQGNTAKGDATQTGDVKSLALLDSVRGFGDTVKKVGDELLDIRPLISVNQGTRIKVFVNKDIIFPKNFGSTIQVIK